jgi:hypothetical protein
MTEKDFDSKNYWRGPVWININWMISQGLKRYGFSKKADAMKHDMIQLPIRFGFHEYFDSQSGQGYGSSDFSWTAALFLDLVYEYYDQDKNRLEWLNLGNPRRLRRKKVLNQESSSRAETRERVASKLMASLWDLRDKFYDLNRGRVDYASMKDSSEYERYGEIAIQLQGFDLMSLDSLDKKMAFWINLYNAIVVQGIVELEISASVKEVPDFFRHIAYNVGGFIFSADDIEHGVLRANTRPPYRPYRPFKRSDVRRRFCLDHIDPRIHFALVCGSRSCAPIRFYSVDLIDEQLDTAAKNFVNSSEVIIIPEENKIFCSQIFNWYKKDFGGRGDILHFLLRHLHESENKDFLKENISAIEIEFLYYDWNLNH